MSTKKIFFHLLSTCIILALILIPFAKVGLAKPAQENASFDEIDAYIQQQMQQLNIPGASLAIVADGKIVHIRGFGEARPGGEAPSPQTPFVLGSLTKSFTALAVMQLVEAGKVDLDAPVQRYLPWFRVADPQASAQITVRHLLNQTSGIPQITGMLALADFDNSPDATERQARALSTLALARPVGSAFEYSNVNYNLLGLIVAAASGETYPGYIQNHIFTPLGMSHSYTSQTAAKQNGLAVGYRYWFALPFAVPDFPIPQGTLPSGQLISSAEDMAHYLIAHLNGGRDGNTQITSSAGIDELHHGMPLADQMGFSLGRYAMGWFDDQSDGTRLLWHNGEVPDFFAYMALLPEQKKGLILLINADQSMMTMTLTDVGAGIAQRLAGQTPAPGRFGAMPWILRGLLLIPVIQLIGVAVTLRQLKRWQREPKRRPGKMRKWLLNILLPLIPNLLLALLLISMLGEMGKFLMLFMADVSWIILICGSFALVWGILRTGLIIWTLRSEPALGSSTASNEA